MPIYDRSTRELLKEWAQANLTPGKTFTRSEPVQWFSERFPKIKNNTISAHIAAMSTNSLSRIHHPVHPSSGHDLFFQIGPNEFRLFQKETDPDPIYQDRGNKNSITTPELLDGAAGEVPEVALPDSEFALERHLQEYLVRNLNQIESGLSPYFDDISDSLEVSAGGRRIDILARDNVGTAVVLELKVSKGYDRVIGQLLRYMGWVRRNLEEGEPVRGIIVASQISDDLILAVSELDGVALFEYKISFSVSRISVD